MADTQNTVNKQVYVSKENLQYVLGLLKTKNEKLYLGKYDEAASAAKVKAGLKITVGDSAEFNFDGSEEKQIAVAAKIHKHVASDITDLKSAVNKIVFGNEDNTGIVMAHEHLNLSVLDGISNDKVAAWDAKIGVDDVEKLAYSNDAMTGVANVKKAIDVLVKNIQINSVVLSDATANVNGLATRLTQAEKDIDALETTVNDAKSGLVKKVADLEAANAEGGTVAQAIADAKKAADDAAAAVVTEKGRAEGEEAKLKASIDAINDETTGILKQAQNYADSKDTEIKNTIGTVAEGKTVVGLIVDAQRQADKGVADAAAEATRATGVENALRADLGQKADPAAAEGSAFARIAQLKVDLAAEVTTARAAEQAALKAGQDAQKDVDALEALVGDAADTKNDATVYGAIAAEKARAEGKEAEIKAIADQNKTDIATLNANKDTEGSVDYKIDQAITNVNTTTSGLVGRVGALETKVGSADDAAKADGSLYARVAKNVADIDAIEADYLKAADKTELQNAINTEKGRLDAFMADADVTEQAVNTLKEIQQYITSDGEAAATMTQDIAANKTAIDAINNKTTGILAQAKADAAAKDEALHTTITGEIGAAKQAAIDAAASDAAGKDTALKTELQRNIDLKADKTALETEVNRATAAEAANKAILDKLDGDVNIDGSVKKQIETVRASLQGNIDAKVAQSEYNAKVADLEAADTALSERIAKFEGDGAGSVAAQVKAVADDLDAHKKAQVTKEKAVDDKLAVIQGEANVEGSIKKALADAKAYTDTKESTINGLLGTKDDAATVDTAFGRIAKEADRAKAAEEALGNRIDTADGKIAALEATVDTKTTGLKDRMTAAEADIDNLESDMTAAQGDITNIQAQLANLIPLTNAELDAMLEEIYR